MGEEPIEPPTQRSATQGPGHGVREISTDWQRPMQRLCFTTRELPEHTVRVWPKSRHWLSEVQGWAWAGAGSKSARCIISRASSIDNCPTAARNHLASNIGNGMALPGFPCTVARHHSFPSSNR